MRQHRDLLIDLNLLFIAIIAGTVVLVIAWRVLEVAFSVLILLLAAMLLAFLLGPLVSRLEAIGLDRGIAVLIVYLGLLTIIFGLGGLFLAPLIQQIGGLAGNLPGDVTKLRHLVKTADSALSRHHIPIHLESLQHQGLTYAQNVGKDVLGNTLTIVQTVSHIVIDILAVIVISLYLLIDGPRIRHNILRIVPDRQRNRVLFVDAALRTVVGGYVRGQLILALTIGLMAAAGCFLLGVRYPLVIGLMAGFFELVPMLGPILGALPAVGIAAFQSWQLAVATVVLFIVIQQLEAHIIAPRIMGHAVGVHPIVAILAVLLGAELDGVLGALVAVPVAGIVYVMAQAAYSRLTDQHQVVTVVRRKPAYLRLYRRFQGSNTAGQSQEGEETISVTVEASSDQLAGIVHERDVLAEQYELAEQVARHASEEETTEMVTANREDHTGTSEGDPRTGARSAS
jgi:predicted PurR-regulated permease PerM